MLDEIKRVLAMAPKKGAYAKDGGYFSQITIDGKNVYLGSYKTAEEAHQAYMKAVEARENDRRRSAVDL